MPPCDCKALESLEEIKWGNTLVRISCEGCICTTKAMLFLCGCDWYQIKKVLAACVVNLTFA